MELELEAVCEERLKHLPELIQRRGACGFRGDVVLFDHEPGGSGDLIIPDEPGPLDAIAQTGVSNRHTARDAVETRAIGAFRNCRFVGFDRGDVEGGGLRAGG